MWRKAQDRKLESSPGASPSSVSSAQHPSTAGRQDSPNAGVSQGIKIIGEISGHGDLFLDGEFEGKICIASGTLTVGPNARVRAEIEAPEIIIRGDVIGTLKASERVHIWSTGKLMGDIETRGIVIDDGAVLRGEINHPPQSSSPEPPPRAKGASA